MTKLYYSPMSCGEASFIAAYCIGLSIDCEQVDIQTHKTHSGADFFTINPKGNVPCLVLDDNSILNENISCLNWIADQVPLINPNKIAALNGTKDRYQVHNALSFIASELHPAIGELKNPTLSAKVIGWMQEKCNQKLTLCENNLLPEGKNFILWSDAPCIADFYLYTVLSWCPGVNLNMSAFPRTQAFYARMSQFPIVKEAMTRMMTNPARVMEAPPNLGDAIKEKVQPVLENIQEKVQPALDKISSTVSTIHHEKIEPAVEAISAQIKPVVEKVQEGLDKTKDFANEKIADLKEKMSRPASSNHQEPMIGDAGNFETWVDNTSVGHIPAEKIHSQPISNSGRFGEAANTDSWMDNHNHLSASMDSNASSEHDKMKGLSPTTAGMVSSLNGMAGSSSPEQISDLSKGKTSNLMTSSSTFATGMTAGQPQQSQAALNSSSVTGNIGNASLTAANESKPVLESNNNSSLTTGNVEEHHSTVSELKHKFDHHGDSSTSSGTSKGTSPGTSTGTSAVGSKKANADKSPQQVKKSPIVPHSTVKTPLGASRPFVDTATTSEEGLTHEKFDAIKYRFNHPEVNKTTNAADLKKDKFNALKDKFSHGSSAPVPTKPAVGGPKQIQHVDENAENKKAINWNSI